LAALSEFAINDNSGNAVDAILLRFLTAGVSGTPFTQIVNLHFTIRTG
jgi:hypothetical protein